MTDPGPNAGKWGLTILLTCLTCTLIPRASLSYGGAILTADGEVEWIQRMDVVIWDAGERTVVTLQPEYRGDADEVIILIPVPDTATNPRLVRAASAFEELDKHTTPQLEHWEPTGRCTPDEDHRLLPGDVTRTIRLPEFESVPLADKELLEVQAFKKTMRFVVDEDTYGAYAFNKLADPDSKLLFARLKTRSDDEQRAIPSLRFEVPGSHAALLGTRSVKAVHTRVWVFSKHGRLEAESLDNRALGAQTLSEAPQSWDEHYLEIRDELIPRDKRTAVTEFAGELDLENSKLSPRFPARSSTTESDLTLTRLFLENELRQVPLSKAEPIANDPTPVLAATGDASETVVESEHNAYRASVIVRSGGEPPECEDGEYAQWRRVRTAPFGFRAFERARAAEESERLPRGVLRCEHEGFPCTAADVSKEAAQRSHRYQVEVVKRLEGGAKLHEVADWLRQQDDVPGAGSGTRGIVFRVKGGRNVYMSGLGKYYERPPIPAYVVELGPAEDGPTDAAAPESDTPDKPAPKAPSARKTDEEASTEQSSSTRTVESTPPSDTSNCSQALPGSRPNRSPRSALLIALVAAWWFRARRTGHSP